MYATLYAFLRMSPSDQARVTHLDLSIADPSDAWRGDGLGVERSSRGDAEEYTGEAQDRNTDQRGFNK